MNKKDRVGWIETPHGFVNLDLVSHISLEKTDKSFRILAWTGTHRVILSESEDASDIKQDYDSLRELIGLNMPTPEEREQILIG